MTVSPVSPSSATPATVPDALGRFGQFGGKYVPETLMPALAELETAFARYKDDPEFQAELNGLLKDYVGRPSLSTSPNDSPNIMPVLMAAGLRFT